MLKPEYVAEAVVQLVTAALEIGVATTIGACVNRVEVGNDTVAEPVIAAVVPA
jgi:hypothetical protein